MKWCAPLDHATRGSSHVQGDVTPPPSRRQRCTSRRSQWRKRRLCPGESPWEEAWNMGLLPDTKNCKLRMCRECWERFPHHRLQRKPLFSDPGMNHYTCVTHLPWCMSGWLTRVGGENVPGIPGACATRNFTYLARGSWWNVICWYECIAIIWRGK